MFPFYRSNPHFSFKCQHTLSVPNGLNFKFSAVRAFGFFRRKKVNLRMKMAPRDREREKNCNGKRYGTVWRINSEPLIAIIIKTKPKAYDPDRKDKISSLSRP